MDAARTATTKGTNPPARGRSPGLSLRTDTELLREIRSLRGKRARDVDDSRLRMAGQSAPNDERHRRRGPAHPEAVDTLEVRQRGGDVPPPGVRGAALVR